MSRKRKTLFVAMPFRDEYASVLAVIRSAAGLLDVEAIHLGEKAYTGSITTMMCNSIDKADALIAVASEENGNVYYEIGLAHCQRKPVAILTCNPSSLKFDLRDHRALVYDTENPGAIRDDLVRTISAALVAPDGESEYLASAFRGLSPDPENASNQGLRKAVDTVSVELDLAEPVQLTERHYNVVRREIAIEVQDYMGRRARALVDVNGIVRSIKMVPN
jgi:hypothetical protein